MWTYANLGVAISNAASRSVGIRWWATYCSLGWDYTEEENHFFGPWVGIWLSNKLASELYNEMRSKLEGVRLDEGIVWVGHKMTIDEVPQFDKELDKLLKKWISACRKIGGLKILV